jgi:hypothetical protein
MKEEKQRNGRNSIKPAAARSRSRKPVDLTDIREQITNQVGNDAVWMVETTIEEVGKGHYLGDEVSVRNDWTLPGHRGEQSPEQNSMAEILLRLQNLPGAPIAAPSVTKDDETPAAAADDGIE